MKNGAGKQVSPASTRPARSPRAQSTVLGLGAGHVDVTMRTPLYHQIYLLLRERIRRGDLRSGTVLPGEQELARAFRVSRITVKRALNELAGERLVTRHRGRGTIVAVNTVTPMVRGSFDNLIESLQRMGIETQVQLLDVRNVPADAQVAEYLEVDPGTQVQLAVRLRKLNNEPFSHLVTYIPAKLAARYTRSQLASTPLLTLLERAGAVVIEAEQWISAAAAEGEIAQTLHVNAGSPLLKIERVMRTAGGKPVQFICGHYRPDRFQYHFISQRKRGRSGRSSWV